MERGPTRPPTARRTSGWSTLHWVLLILGAALAASPSATTTAGPRRPTPFYQDPLFDAAHDAEFVWHEGEQCWWSVPTRFAPTFPRTPPVREPHHPLPL